jgi:hypothetical protein
MIEGVKVEVRVIDDERGYLINAPLDSPDFEKFAGLHDHRLPGIISVAHHLKQTDNFIRGWDVGGPVRHSGRLADEGNGDLRAGRQRQRRLTIPGVCHGFTALGPRPLPSSISRPSCTTTRIRRIPPPLDDPGDRI